MGIVCGRVSCFVLSEGRMPRSGRKKGDGCSNQAVKSDPELRRYESRRCVVRGWEMWTVMTVWREDGVENLKLSIMFAKKYKYRVSQNVEKG